MKLYALTEQGGIVARNTNNPDTAEYRVLHHLDFIRMFDHFHKKYLLY